MNEFDASTGPAGGRRPARAGEARPAAQRWRIRRAGPAAALVALLAAAAPARAVVMIVTTLDDADAAEGECSLREAIVAANTDTAYRECPAGFGADEIEIAPAGPITLVADLPQIVAALTVRGRGPGDTVIDGGGAFEVFHMTSATAGNNELLRIEALQVTGGLAAEGGAIYVGRNRALEVVDCALVANEATLEGGAVRGDRPVTVLVERSSLVDNHAATQGGAVSIDIVDDALFVDSTFAGNRAEGASGGAIHAQSVDQVVIRRSTLSGNSAASDGGGISSVVSALRVESSTLVGNLTDSDADDVGDGGGLSIAGPVQAALVDSVLAGNDDDSPTASLCPDGFQKLGAAVVTEGFNLVGANDCIAGNFPAGEPNVHGDLVGTAAAPVDPLLGPLGANGGPTATHPPMAASPVVDQGSCPGAVADQRGYGNLATGLRIIDDPQVTDFADGCDIGAVEAGAVSLEGLVFADDFETGDTSRWSATVP